MFHPRIVLYGKVGDSTVQIAATEASIDVEVIDAVARITTDIKFINSNPTLVSALNLQSYFDERSVLCGFEAKVGPTAFETRVEKLEGNVEPHQPLVEYASEETPLMFSVMLGNLNPGEEATVKITSVTQLNYTEGEVEFYWPTLKKQLTAFNISKFNISMAMSKVILGVFSTSHVIKSLNSEERIRTTEVILDDTKENSDIFITIDVDESLPLVTVQEDEETGSKMAMVSFQPAIEDFGDAFAEVYFFVDRSGSMDKFNRLQHGILVKDMLPLLLAKLPPGSLFNIIGYGSTYESVFATPQEINVRPVEEALRTISKWEADLGGTLIEPSLLAFLGNPVKSGFVRHVIILTDGEVEKVDSVLKIAAVHTISTTFSVIKIGKETVENFPRTLARVGHGEYVLVNDGNFLELVEKSKDLLENLFRPYITNLALSLKTISEEYAPFLPHPIRKGDSIEVYGLLKPDAIDGILSISGETSKGPYQMNIPIGTSMTCTGLSLHRMGATYLIHDLEKGQSTFSPSATNLTGSKEQALNDKIWELSVWNNVPSSVSYLAVFIETEDFSMDQKPVSSDYRFVYNRTEKDPKPAEKADGLSNAGASFWATFGFSNESNLDKLLDSGEYTLEQLLDEDDLFSEAQANNDALIHFLTKSHAARKIFGYVSSSSVPTMIILEDDPKFQYIYLCTELLALPLWDEALDSIYAEGSQCMESLINVLTKPDVDDQQVFRVCRVFAAFMGFHLEKLIAYFKTQTKFIPILLRNLKVSFVVDFLKALLKPDSGPSRSEILEWLFSAGLFEDCVTLLGPNNLTAVQDNASEILVLLIGAAREVELTSRPYESQQTMDRIFEVMFDGNLNPTKSYLKGLDVLGGIANILALNPSVTTHPCLLLILPHFEKFKRIITAPLRQREGSFGAISIAGEAAVGTLKFFDALIKTMSPHIDQRFIDLDILTHCMDLFFRSGLNNFIHAAVQTLFVNVLMTPREDSSLRSSLLLKSDLPGKLIYGIRLAKNKTEKGYNTGHIAWGGHLYKIALALVSARIHPDVAKLLDDNQSWKEFERVEFVAEQQLYAGWNCAPPKRV